MNVFFSDTDIAPKMFFSDTDIRPKVSYVITPRSEQNEPLVVCRITAAVTEEALDVWSSIRGSSTVAVIFDFQTPISDGLLRGHNHKIMFKTLK